MADTFVAEQVTSIPLGQILLGPAFELAKAQRAFADIVSSYIKDVALNADGSAKMVRMGAEVSERDDKGAGTGKSVKLAMDVWMGELAPPPFVKLVRFKNKFTLVVSAATSQSSENKGEVAVEGKAGFGWWSASVKASYSHASKSTRETDTRATIECEVEYEQGDAPEVWKAIMSFLRNTRAAPIEADKAPALPKAA